MLNALMRVQMTIKLRKVKKQLQKLDVIIGDPDRLRAVANDFINHYETRIAEKATVAGKAMFVYSNRYIVYDFGQDTH